MHTPNSVNPNCKQFRTKAIMREKMEKARIKKEMRLLHATYTTWRGRDWRMEDEEVEGCCWK